MTYASLTSDACLTIDREEMLAPKPMVVKNVVASVKVVQGTFDVSPFLRVTHKNK